MYSQARHLAKEYHFDIYKTSIPLLQTVTKHQVIHSARLVQPQHTEKVILEGNQIQKESIVIPRESAGNGAGHRVQHKVVCRGDDGSQDDGRVDHAADDGYETLPPEPTTDSERDSGDGQTDEEGVSKVKGWHGSWRGVSVLVAFFVSFAT